MFSWLKNWNEAPIRKRLRKNPDQIIVKPTFLAFWLDEVDEMVLVPGDYMSLNREDAFLVVLKERNRLLNMVAKGKS
jgi:hypothetical protein